MPDKAWYERGCRQAASHQREADQKTKGSESMAEDTKAGNEKKLQTVTDEQIVTVNKFPRRSFLTATGALLAGAVALAAGARASAQAQDPDQKKATDPDQADKKKKKMTKAKSKAKSKKKAADPDKKKATDPDKKPTDPDGARR